jgi:hypothetical protein
LSLTVPVVVILLAFRASEPIIRIAGLLLQLVGISTVVYGIDQTRRLFGHPSLVNAGMAWLSSFPRLHPPPRVAVLDIDTGTIRLTGSGVALRHRAAPGATLETRVHVLESNIDSLERRLEATEGHLGEAAKTAAEGLLEEGQVRQGQVDAIREKLEATETGGLAISLMGLIWLVVGLILATASQELARLVMALAA